MNRDVIAGKTYYYKVKSYFDLYGKTYVSEASESMQKTAVNQKGIYTVTLLEQDAEKPDDIVVKLHADAYNAVSKFTPEVYTDLLCLTDKTCTIKHLSLRYSGFYYTADLNLTKQTGTAKIASEYYH